MAAEDLTRTELEQYFGLHERRRELNRLSADLERQAGRIEPKVWAYIKKHGGRARAISKWGFNLAVKLARGSVSWKTEFISAVGQEKANEIAAAAPQRESLSVEKVAR